MLFTVNKVIFWSNFKHDSNNYFIKHYLLITGYVEAIYFVVVKVDITFSVQNLQNRTIFCNYIV